MPYFHVYADQGEKSEAEPGENQASRLHHAGGANCLSGLNRRSDQTNREESDRPQREEGQQKAAGEHRVLQRAPDQADDVRRLAILPFAQVPHRNHEEAERLHPRPHHQPRRHHLPGGAEISLRQDHRLRQRAGRGLPQSVPVLFRAQTQDQRLLADEADQVDFAGKLDSAPIQNDRLVGDPENEGGNALLYVLLPQGRA